MNAASTPSTFGFAIKQGRKQKLMSQKCLAGQIKREDGEAISPQYLNDIEHDRRSPSSALMVNQFADVLELNADTLYYLAGKIPDDLIKQDISPEVIKQAMIVFRKVIKG